MAISRIERPRLRSGLQIAVVVASVLEFGTFFFLVVPVTPPDRIHALRLDTVNEVFADSVGWDDIAKQVTTIYDNLPASERANTVIVSAYYGVPGALDVYDSPSTRPVAISPHLSDWYWLPNNLTATSALMVDYAPADVAWMCTSATLNHTPHRAVRRRRPGARRSRHLVSAQGTDPEDLGKASRLLLNSRGQSPAIVRRWRNNDCLEK